MTIFLYKLLRCYRPRPNASVISCIDLNVISFIDLNWNIKAKLNGCYSIVMWGLSAAMISSLHNDSQALETEQNPLNMECGCLHGEVIKNSHTRNSSTLWGDPDSVQPRNATRTNLDVTNFMHSLL